MVIIKNDPRKEATYGWYPSGTNIYLPKNVTRPNEREHLFRNFAGTASRRVAWTPAAAAIATSASSGGGQPRSSPTTQLSVTGSRPPVTLDLPQFALEPLPPAPRRLPPRAQSASVRPVHSSARKCGREALIPTPSRSELGLRSSPSSESISVLSSEAQLDGEPVAATRVARRRAWSAVAERHRGSASVATPDDAAGAPSSGALPLSSDGRRLRRPATATAVPVSRQHVFDDADLPATVARPLSPTVSHQPGVSDRIGEASPVATAGLALEVGGSSEPLPPPLPTYDEQLERYGWRAEIPGDPLNLKVITQRLPYTLNCSEPAVRPNPPSVCVMDNNTFFYNTIPKRPLSFTVHPEWQSELFVTKRIDLEKRSSGKFHTRNYAFAY